MFRALLSLLLLCSPMLAQLTTVSGTLSDAMGAAPPVMTATISFRPGATFTSSSGWVVPGSIPRSVAVANGAFSVQLVPTSTGTPVTYYEVRARVPLQTASGTVCEGNATLIATGACVVGPLDWGPVYLSVPSSPSAVDWKDYYVTARPPAPPLYVRVSQVHPAEFTEGSMYCLKKVSGVVTLVACTGGGGGAPANSMTWNGSTMTWNGSTMTWN